MNVRRDYDQVEVEIDLTSPRQRKELIARTPEASEDEAENEASSLSSISSSPERPVPRSPWDEESGGLPPCSQIVSIKAILPEAQSVRYVAVACGQFMDWAADPMWAERFRRMSTRDWLLLQVKSTIPPHEHSHHTPHHYPGSFRGA